MTISRRGLVLAPSDLHELVERWLDLFSEGSLNVLGLHGDVETLLAFESSDEGRRLRRGAEERGIDIEYEIHALGSLLPRDLFETRPEWFRMDESGGRTPDANLCGSNDDALAYVAERALDVAKRLTPTTNRFYFWADDAKPWCHCPACRGLTASDQNTRVMNAIAARLREWRPDAILANLAYWNTLDAPENIAPSEALFLEYAPIKRNSALPLTDENDPANRDHAARLRRLVSAFPMENAQVLEYWMDASRFSGWKRPSVRIPFDPDVLAEDVRFYASLGFSSMTSFGVFLDADYFARYGTPPVLDYGRILASDVG